MAGSSGGSKTLQEKIYSPELVKKVAEKVYALWLKDLQIERERQQTVMSQRNWSKRR